MVFGLFEEAAICWSGMFTFSFMLDLKEVDGDVRGNGR